MSETEEEKQKRLDEETFGNLKEGIDDNDYHPEYDNTDNREDENPSTSKRKQKENNVSRENSPQPANANSKPSKGKRKREPSPPVDQNVSAHGRPIRQRKKNIKYD